MTAAGGDELQATPAEQSVLGSLLLDPEAWAKVAPLLRADDFILPNHRLIFQAIADLAANGKAYDPVIVSEALAKTTTDSLGVDNPQAAGGLAYLSEITRNTPTASNVATYAQIVRDKAVCRRLHALLEEAPAGTVLAEGLLRETSRLRETITPAVPAIQLVHIAAVVAEKRETDWLDGLEKVLERSVLAVLAGSRGTFKSFIALHWSLSVALKRLGVVFLSAEGRGLGVRTEAWMGAHAPKTELCELPFVVLERAVDLNSRATLEALHAAIDGSGVEPALIVIDTFSKFSPGLEENENAEVASYLASLSSALRDRYGATVLLVAHSGHGDSRRPRGASVLMANPDAEYIVERPDPAALTVTVSRERFKDSPALTALAYKAEVVNLGRSDRGGVAVTSLVMRDTQVAIARPRLSGKNQKALLAKLEALIEAGQLGIWSEGELRKLAREQVGMGKQSAIDAVHSLRSLGYLVATTGGSRLGHVPESETGQKVRNGSESQISDLDGGYEKYEGSLEPVLSDHRSDP